MQNALKSNFNSIKVRLRRGALGTIRVVVIFQFHKGSIKTDTGNDLGALITEFQFHKGSIKTDLRPRLNGKKYISIP